MRVYLILLYLVQIYTFDIPKKCRSDLTIDKEHYDTMEVYNIGDANPTETHYDKYGNLFFIQLGRHLEEYYYDAKVIRQNSTDAEKIEGLPDGQCYSIAVDNTNSTVYFGTGKGIYAYNYDSEDAELISSPNIKPNELFLDKDGNKYITESLDGIEQLYLLSGEQKIRFKSTVNLEAFNEVAIDDKNNIYFIRDEQLFVLKSNLSSPILVGNVTYDGVAQISFHKNTVYVASDTLFYIHENETGSLRNVNVADNITAIAFDFHSNLVLGMYGKIIKYKNNQCYHTKV